jgi:hypothetical protein
MHRIIDAKTSSHKLLLIAYENANSFLVRRLEEMNYGELVKKLNSPDLP